MSSPQLTPEREITATPRCNGMVSGGGVMSFHCSLPQSHREHGPEDDREPCYAIESDRSGRAWSDWRERQNAREAAAASTVGDRRISCPACRRRAMVIAPDGSGDCENCGEHAEPQIEVTQAASGEPPIEAIEVRLEPDDQDGGWVAEVVGVPGVMSQGETRQEALENVVAALQEVRAAPDLAPLSEDVSGHTMARGYAHEDGRGCGYHNRLGKWVTAVSEDEDEGVIRMECLRDHTEQVAVPEGFLASLPDDAPGLREMAAAAREPQPVEGWLDDADPDRPTRDVVAVEEVRPQPTRTRPGDQRLPDGDESKPDDQLRLIADIETRRQLGVERYGQAHRTFNGRDTLQDWYDEQLDRLVYARSLVTMAQATREDLVEVVYRALEKNAKEGRTAAVVTPQSVRREAAEVAVDRVMGWVVGTHLLPPDQPDSVQTMVLDVLDAAQEVGASHRQVASILARVLRPKDEPQEG